MGTYDTAGGTPRHDPMFDESDGIAPVEDALVDTFEAIQRLVAAGVELAETVERVCTNDHGDRVLPTDHGVAQMLHALARWRQEDGCITKSLCRGGVVEDGPGGGSRTETEAE